MKLEEKNSTRSMMRSHYNDEKVDKSSELNESMTIKKTSSDEYTRTIYNIGGNQ